LLRSDDGGGTWQRAAALADASVTALAFSSRYADTSKLAAATSSGVALSGDGGRTWSVARGAPPGIVLSLAFVGSDSGEALLAGLDRAGVARSVDDGATWTLAASGLDATVLSGLVLSPNFAEDRTMVVHGPRDGLRISRDGGTNWLESNAGLDDWSVTS